MPWCKYTREVLSEAVMASTSMAGVLRHLGLPLNGGSHAHLRRRITLFGIDTSHFSGRPDMRGMTGTRRRAPHEVLVLRPADSRRAAPGALRRALEALGRPHRCEACGVDGTWQGRPLTLQVDHVDGRFWDCRPGNLRFLCPNCHSQTATHAGRNRSQGSVTLVRVDDRGNPVHLAAAASPMSDEQLRTTLSRVTAGELSASDAARLLGCHRNRIGRLRKRLANPEPDAPRRPTARVAALHRDEVIALALRHPALGSKKIAAALRTREAHPITIAHGTVATILAAAGLNTSAARRAAASGGAPPKTTV
jgi:hypothetical protein